MKVTVVFIILSALMFLIYYNKANKKTFQILLC